MGALRRKKLVGAPVPYSFRRTSLPDGAITESHERAVDFPATPRPDRITDRVVDPDERTARRGNLRGSRQHLKTAEGFRQVRLRVRPGHGPDRDDIRGVPTPELVGLSPHRLVHDESHIHRQAVGDAGTSPGSQGPHGRYTPSREGTGRSPRRSGSSRHLLLRSSAPLGTRSGHWAPSSAFLVSRCRRVWVWHHARDRPRLRVAFASRFRPSEADQQPDSQRAA